MKKRFYIVFLIIALIFSLLTITVNAAESEFKVTLDSSSTSVEKGKEFTVTLNVSDFEENVEKGINRVSGTLKIDDKAFEKITSDSVEGLNDWKVSYDESTGELECTKLKTITKGQDICEITLETKSSTSSTSGKIELSKLTASDSDVELSADDTSLDLTISSEGTRRITSNSTNTNSSSTNTRLTRNLSNVSTNTNANTNTNTNTSSNDDNENEANSSNSRITRYNTNTNNSSTNTNEGNSNNNNSSSESNEEEMPNTGLDDSIVKAILLIALIGIFGYIKIKSLDRK